MVEAVDREVRAGELACIEQAAEHEDRVVAAHPGFRQGQVRIVRSMLHVGVSRSAVAPGGGRADTGAALDGTCHCL
jgi:hypothetical protein